jgi:hypothetical protein
MLFLHRMWLEKCNRDSSATAGNQPQLYRSAERGEEVQSDRQLFYLRLPQLCSVFQQQWVNMAGLYIPGYSRFWPNSLLYFYFIPELFIPATFYPWSFVEILIQGWATRYVWCGISLLFPTEKVFLLIDYNTTRFFP